VAEHLQHLDQVLQILETSGLRLNKAKCAFLLSKIEYLGHVIDELGLYPTQEKLRLYRRPLSLRTYKNCDHSLG